MQPVALHLMEGNLLVHRWDSSTHYEKMVSLAKPDCEMLCIDLHCPASTLNVPLQLDYQTQKLGICQPHHQ
jgi:hypothetical protein